MMCDALALRSRKKQMSSAGLLPLRTTVGCTRFPESPTVYEAQSVLEPTLLDLDTPMTDQLGCPVPWL